MQAQQIEIVGGNLLALVVAGGVHCVVNVMAIHGIHRDALELGELGQKILQVGTVSDYQLRVQIGQNFAPAPAMEAVKEGGARDLFPEDFPGQLKEVPAAGGLAQHTADAQAKEPEVIQRTIAINATDVVAQDVNGRGEDLIQQTGTGLEFVGVKESVTHQMRVSNPENKRRRE
jgi:hypothetical protein